MMTSKVILAFLTELRSRLNGFPLIEKNFYDTGMSFDPRVRKYIISNDLFLETTLGTEDWVALVWNRDALRISQVYQRGPF